MEEIKNQYMKDVERNIKNIKKILKNEIKIEDSENILNLINKKLNETASQIVSNWEEEKKYVRTLFVKNNLKNYPKEFLDISVSLDAEINLLDDLLDENLDKMEKAICVVNILRSRSLNDFKELNTKTRKMISNYFEKLICVAILEKTYREKIENETDYKKILDLSKEIYRCRSLDMDIFVQIPIFNSYRNVADEEKEKIIEKARLFRSLNLIKKDILDMDHDYKNGIPNVLLSLKKQKLNTKKFVKDISDLFLEESEKFPDSEIDNFKDSMKKEIEEFNL